MVVERLADRFVRGALQTRLDRRVDPQPPLADPVRAVHAHELVEDVREEVRLLDLAVEAAGLEPQRIAARVAVLRTRDVPVPQHGVQHLVAAPDRSAWIVERVVDRRRLRKAGEQCALGEREL